MKNVRPKKALGQHFLKDLSIAKRIADSLETEGVNQVVEIGSGMGVLTQFLVEKDIDLRLVEIDDESINYLHQNYPLLAHKIIHADFLKMNIDDYFKPPFAVIGNFPYHISNLILFKIFENRDKITFMSGMFQREVALRVTSPPGSKVYGILSVLIQAFFDVEYLFTVDENVFYPPPKVKSGVFRIRRNNTKKLDCDEKRFKTVVKTAFNQRRKMLRNSLKAFLRSLFL